jgi:sec-independent protein translocase protein TatA
MSNLLVAYGFGSQELIILAVLLLVLFGSTKIPQLMRGIGEGIREFRKEASGEGDTSTPKM